MSSLSGPFHSDEKPGQSGRMASRADDRLPIVDRSDV